MPAAPDVDRATRAALQTRLMLMRNAYTHASREDVEDLDLGFDNVWDLRLAIRGKSRVVLVKFSNYQDEPLPSSMVSCLHDAPGTARRLLADPRWNNPDAWVVDVANAVLAHDDDARTNRKKKEPHLLLRWLQAAVAESELLPHNRRVSLMEGVPFQSFWDRDVPFGTGKIVPFPARPFEIFDECWLNEYDFCNVSLLLCCDDAMFFDEWLRALTPCFAADMAPARLRVGIADLQVFDEPIEDSSLQISSAVLDAYFRAFHTSHGGDGAALVECVKRYGEFEKWFRSLPRSVGSFMFQDLFLDQRWYNDG